MLCTRSLQTLKTKGQLLLTYTLQYTTHIVQLAHSNKRPKEIIRRVYGDIIQHRPSIKTSTYDYRHSQIASLTSLLVSSCRMGTHGGRWTLTLTRSLTKKEFLFCRVKAWVFFSSCCFPLSWCFVLSFQAGRRRFDLQTEGSHSSVQNGDPGGEGKGLVFSASLSVSQCVLCERDCQRLRSLSLCLSLSLCPWNIDPMPVL